MKFLPLKQGEYYPEGCEDCGETGLIIIDEDGQELCPDCLKKKELEKEEENATE